MLSQNYEKMDLNQASQTKVKFAHVKRDTNNTVTTTKLFQQWTVTIHLVNFFYL